MSKEPGINEKGLLRSGRIMEMDNQDRIYMARAIEIARQGRGYVNPNPQVGAVIVKDGRIIGEGAHLLCGSLHAERNAISNLTESAEGATIYVTLEPCCHHGKQPPCTEALVENKIAKVVIGSRDPNPQVSGKGTKFLREHGIEVIENFMREECDELNPIFFHYITTGMPYVAIKYAMTIDGKIATKTGASRWVTGEEARKHVHTLRGRYACIMAGIGTVLADDPLLNCREEGGHQPVRVICDTQLRIPMDSQIVKTAGEYRTIVACGSVTGSETIREKKKALEADGNEVLSHEGDEGRISMKELLTELGKMKLDSVFVEGGGEIHDALLRTGLANHLYAYVALKIFGSRDAKSPVGGTGVALPSEAAMLKNMNITKFGDDILIEGDFASGFVK